MGPSGNLRCYQRSKSCNSYLEKLSSYNDEALSRAIWGNQNNELTKIWPLVDVEHETLQSHLAEFKLMARELVKNYSYTRCTNNTNNLRDLLILAYKFPKEASWYIFGALMNLAYQIPGEFTLDSFEYLMETVVGENAVFRLKYQILMEELAKDYLYNLMKLGRGVFLYEFPHMEFEDLMRYAHHLFPEEFPQELFTNSYGDDRSEYVITLENNIISLEDKIRSLEDKIMSLEQKAEEKESLLAEIYHKLSARELVKNNSYTRNDKPLMQKAHRLFPNKFWQERSIVSYRAMIAFLVNRDSILEDEKSLAINNRKLECLRDAAENFRWSNQNTSLADEDFGKQFFLLCKYVAESNRDEFHPKLEGPRMIEFVEIARKGLFKIDGVDVGPAVEVLYMNRSS